MIEKQRSLAAPCGLYCGACVLYRANKRGDSEFLAQGKENFTQMLSHLKEQFADSEEGQQIPGMPPSMKGLDISRMLKEMQVEGSLCCEGCLSDVVAPQCRVCGFRDCTKEKGITTCAECCDMPCQWVIDFKGDGMPHHSEVVTNLERQREIGIDAWLAEQEEKWRCGQCGSPLSWYDAKCPDCHATPSQTFGSSPFSD